MKTKIALIIGAAIITLSFTFASVSSKSTTQTAKATVKESIGGFVSESKL